MYIKVHFGIKQEGLITCTKYSNQYGRKVKYFSETSSYYVCIKIQQKNKNFMKVRL